MSTATQVISNAYSLMGVHNPTSTDLSRGLTTLNDMITFWGAERLLVYAVKYESFALTIADAQYSIGTGGDFNTVRPIRIEGAFVRDSNSVDYNLNILTEDLYKRKSNKSENGRPEGLYYAPEYPLGVIYLDKKPDTALTLYLSNWKLFTGFSALSDAVSFPPQYERAIKFNLAVELAPQKNIQMVQTVYGQAEESKMIIRGNNSQQANEAQYDSVLSYALYR